MERAHLADALSAILHTVVFYRTSGTVKPVDRACRNIPTTYATRGDPGVDEKVHDGVSRFLTSLREVTPPHARASLIVSFYYEHQVSNFFFSRREEKVWEIWRFPITVIPPNTVVAHDGPPARVDEGEDLPSAPGLADLEQTGPWRKGNTRLGSSSPAATMPTGRGGSGRVFAPARSLRLPPQTTRVPRLQPRGSRHYCSKSATLWASSTPTPRPSTTTDSGCGCCGPLPTHRH